MHAFTIVQLVGLGILWAVKDSPIALAFPFFVVLMVPLRMILKFFFTPEELEAVSFFLFCQKVSWLIFFVLFLVGWQRCWKIHSGWGARFLWTSPWWLKTFCCIFSHVLHKRINQILYLHCINQDKISRSIKLCNIVQIFHVLTVIK